MKIVWNSRHVCNTPFLHVLIILIFSLTVVCDESNRYEKEVYELEMQLQAHSVEKMNESMKNISLSEQEESQRILNEV